MASSDTQRYSDEELAEFKAIIDTKLANAKEQLQSLQEQIIEITENSGDEHGGDWMDDSSTNNEVEMLNTMAIRQRKFINDLENASVRIRNKTYGICVITGELIDKRRLLAVPTTTKSVLAKTEERKKTEDSTITRLTNNPYVKKKEGPKEKPVPKIITKVIRKSSPQTPKPPIDEDDDLDLDAGFGDDFDLDVEDDNLPDDDIDFDNIPDSDTEEDY